MNKYLVSMSINILPYFHSLPLYDVSGGSGRQGTFIYTVDWVWISDELGVISFTEAGPLPELHHVPCTTQKHLGVTAHSVNDKYSYLHF